LNKQPYWKDWGLWLVLAFNAYAVYFYTEHPNSISSIYLLFWLQSFFIGVFTIIGMLSFTNRVENSFARNDNFSDRPGCTAGFFAIHYGGFHFVYLIFLFAMMIKIHQVDWLFVKISFWAIVAGCIMQFVQDKKRNKTEAVNMGTMFFLPYARIIPMHITILAPQFLHISAPFVFLILKTFADLVMHLVYRNLLFKSVSAK
jgi:hypothetical protein